jgi:hypothetical protein
VLVCTRLALVVFAFGHSEIAFECMHVSFRYCGYFVSRDSAVGRTTGFGLDSHYMTHGNLRSIQHIFV